MMFVNSIRIKLDERTVWSSLEINPDAPFKVVREPLKISPIHSHRG